MEKTNARTTLEELFREFKDGKFVRHFALLGQVTFSDIEASGSFLARNMYLDGTIMGQVGIDLSPNGQPGMLGYHGLLPLKCRITTEHIKEVLLGYDYRSKNLFLSSRYFIDLEIPFP